MASADWDSSFTLQTWPQRGAERGGGTPMAAGFQTTQAQVPPTPACHQESVAMGGTAFRAKI